METKRKNEANERIREYLKQARAKQPKEPKTHPRKSVSMVILIRRKQDDRVLATVVENMPAKYKEEEICRKSDEFACSEVSLTSR